VRGYGYPRNPVQANDEGDPIGGKQRGKDFQLRRALARISWMARSALLPFVDAEFCR
jgi:hypothetical protein